MKLFTKSLDHGLVRGIATSTTGSNQEGKEKRVPWNERLTR